MELMVQVWKAPQWPQLPLHQSDISAEASSNKACFSLHMSFTQCCVAVRCTLLATGASLQNPLVPMTL
jgi:hypothetical protein